MHKLLAKQIRRHLNPDGTIPPMMRPFIAAIDEAYQANDSDRALLERSLELTSQELGQRYAALRQQQREQEVIFNSVPAQIFFKDGENRILRLNEVAAKSFGRSISELQGASCFQLFPEETARALHADDLEVIRSGVGKFGIIERHPDAEGVMRWFRTDKVPYRDDKGSVVGVIVFSLDITNQKSAEERLESAYHQMEELVKFRTRFLNTTAHELRTPLTPILLQSHMLRTGLEQFANETQRKGFEILDRNIHRLDRLVSDVLDAARLQSGRLQLRRALLDLSRICSDTVESFIPVAASAGVSIELLPCTPAEIDGDAARLTQVLYNLVSNAIKFTPEGGHVTVTCGIEGKDVVVAVRDTGLGITGENILRLFQPFTQVHDPTQRVAPGTGLGLYVSRGIVEEHGGTIACHSGGLGKGSTFSIRLPLHRAIADPAMPAAEDEKAILPGADVASIR